MPTNERLSGELLGILPKEYAEKNIDSCREIILEHQMAIDALTQINQPWCHGPIVTLISRMTRFRAMINEIEALKDFQ